MKVTIEVIGFKHGRILKCGQLQRLGLTTKVGGYLAIGPKSC